MKDKADEFLDYVRREKSKNTFNVYSFGVRKFLSWMGKSGTEILEDHKKRAFSEDQHEKDFYKRKISEFYSKLKADGLSQNSARTQSTGIVAFFSYYGFTMNLKRDFWQVQITAGDFVPTVEEYRRMFNVADVRGRVILSMGLDLAWRVGDFVSIKKAEIPDLSREAPIPFERVTKKEGVLSKTFISSETVELLKAYLPTLKEANEYLFQNGNGSNIQDQTVNDVLQSLARKASLKIPQGKRLRFHNFRKRFLSTCADLRIDPNIAKILVGKAVSPDMLTYLSEVTLKESWLAVKEKLLLMNGKTRATMTEKDEEVRRLQNRVKELELTLRGMTEIFGDELFKKAVAKLNAEMGPLKSKPPAREKLGEMLREIGRLKEDKDQAEYEKMIAENNGNGNHA